MATGDYLLALGGLLLLKQNLSTKTFNRLVAALVLAGLVKLSRRARIAWRRRQVRQRHLKAVVVGAGFSGVGAAITLQKLGVEYEIYERGDGIGGTWLWNTYPGCECDVQSHLYSYSFAPNPRWTKRWARQPEILAYIQKVARDFGVEPHVHTRHEVVSATWKGGQWEVVVQPVDGGDQQVITADLLIAGCGQLHKPQYPTGIPGFGQFTGETVHTARWDHSINFKGKRVACIGTGASAIQVVPELAKEAGHITVFQRTPGWVLKKPDAPYAEATKSALTHFDCLRRLHRLAPWLIGEFWFVSALLKSDPIKGSAFVHNQFRAEMTSRVKPENREELLPKLIPDFPLGCKRTLVTNDWIETLQLPNVDLCVDPVTAFTPKGVSTQQIGEQEFDIIVYATGFDTKQFTFPMVITNGKGEGLKDVWSGGQGKAFLPRAYLGIAVPDFPNFFMLYGPTTNLGTNSIIFMIECQLRYVEMVVQEMVARGCRTAQVTQQGMDRYYATARDDLAKTTFADPACGISWYKNADGIVVNNWPATTTQYNWRTSTLKPEDWVFA